MLIVLNLGLILFAALLVLLPLVVIAYFMARKDVCFTFGIEGAAKMVVKGNVHVRTLMWWKGHYVNTPRRCGYQPKVRSGEVLEHNRPDKHASQYAWWKIHWKFFELFGIYWYGLYPFKRIYVYKFEWAEEKIGEDGKSKPWHRSEHTDHIFVKNFPYWVKLSMAEDKNNLALDMDYLLTIHINNPEWALFHTDDWLKRVSADANNRAKVYVGSREFNEIKTEKGTGDTGTSEFADSLCKLNDNLTTEPGVKGTKLSYGVTINGAAMVSLAPAGAEAEKVMAALEAKRVAELNADALVATADGYAESERRKAHGDADATRRRADGEADAIGKVYDKVQSYGPFGFGMRQLDTLKAAADSKGSHTIWANNPLAGVGEWLPGIIKPTEPSNPPHNQQGGTND